MTIEGFRLSPQQRHLWSLIEGNEPAAFATQCVVNLTGEVNRARLAAAIAEVVARHEILRTGFVCLPGMTVPVQVIAEDGATELRDGAAAEDERRQPFALETAPLLRAALLGDDRLVLTLPALCADTIGLHNLVRELARCYAGHDAADEPMQYADLAEWQNEMLESAEPEQALQVDPGSPRSALPRANGREDAAFAPQSVRLNLSSEVADGIGKLARQQSVDAAAVELAAWLVLLQRLSGQADLVVGVECEGRAFEGLDSALGLFARHLPLALSVAGEMPFADLVSAVSASVAGLQDRQEYFSWAAGDAAGQPYFPLSFGHEDRDVQCDGGGVTFAIAEQYACTEQFDVRLVAGRRQDGGFAELHYDRHRHAEADVAHWLQLYGTLLSDAVARPQSPVDELNSLSPQERQRVVFEWNETPAVDVVGTVLEQIERQVDQRPDAVAVRCGDHQLSYRDLDARGNAVAAALLERGVTAGSLVGLCVQRSIELVVGIVGILKAGAGYLPLDPGYPGERLAYMLEDSGAAVLLTQQHLLDGLPVHGAEVVCFDDAGTADRGSARPQSEDLAYVIYTSGSTGQPKGVEISHATLAHSTAARALTYDQPPQTYLLLSSFAFDSSVAGIFWTLTSGGTLVIPAEGLERDLHELSGLMQRHQVTHTLALPSLYSLLLREAVGSLTSLQIVIVAGEACPRELVELHAEALPSTQLFNEYGPTEATVWSSVHRCFPGDLGARIPIGRPIAGAQIYLLDRRRQPVPAGVAGEIYIGGAGIARGYLGRPEMTAERFVANPFPATPGPRLYRTGDLARQRLSGEIDFLGRVDHQVKIRGYRIELEEIEATMRVFPGVADAAVAAREDNSGDKRLVGYLASTNADSPPDVTELQSFLSLRLPDYMVPGAIVVLEQLPLGPTGKVDRSALPAPDAANVRTVPFVAPRTPVEQVLAEIWREILRADEIGIDDNFFQLGGHSLLVTQLVFRVRDTFQVELPLRAVFEAPTVAAQCELLLADPQQRQRVEQAAGLVTELSNMSDEQVEEMLRRRGQA